MRRIREVLRLRDEFSASQRQIADACRLPRSTVRDYLERLRICDLRYEDVLGWTDVELEERLFPPPATSVRPVPEWRHVSRELGRRGVTLRLLWEEYLEAHPDGYRYTQFVQHFRAWQGTHAEPRLRREHRPGAAIEVDYAGMTLSVGLGAEARQAQVCAACVAVFGLRLRRGDLDPAGGGMAGLPCPAVQASRRGAGQAGARARRASVATISRSTSAMRPSATRRSTRPTTISPVITGPPPLGSNNTELGQMGAKAVDQHGPLTHKQIARPVQHQTACCSSPFTGTKAMCGLVTASAMAAASVASFFLPCGT